MKKAIENNGGQKKSPCSILWADETWAVSHEKKRQDRGLLCLVQTHHLKVSKSKTHVAKPRGQKIQKIQETTTRGQKICSRGHKIYARSKGESNQSSKYKIKLHR